MPKLFLSRYWKSSAGRAANGFASAAGVGGGSAIVVMRVGMRRNRNSIEKLNEGIGGPRRVGKLIEKQKTVVGRD